MQAQHLSQRSLKLRLPAGINKIRIVHPPHLFPRRNHDDIQPVNLTKFVCIRGCCSRHASDLFIHIEVTLVGHRCHRPAFLRNRYMLLGLQRLMLTTSQLRIWLHTPRPVIQQQYRIVSDNIALILLNDSMCPERQTDMTDDLIILR